MLNCLRAVQIQQLPTSTLPRYFLRKPLRAKRYYRLWLLMRDINFMVAIVPVMTEIWTMRNVRGSRVDSNARRAEQIRARNKDLGWFVSMSSRVWIDVIASRERESAREKEYFLLLFFPKHLWKKDSYSFPRKDSIFVLKMPTFHRNFKKSCPIFWTIPYF